MKKSLILILFVMFASGLSAQSSETVVNNEVELIKKDTPKQEVNSKTKTSSYSKLKAKLIQLNHKKSNDIISIKAYRKSLHIKVKTIILC